MLKTNKTRKENNFSPGVDRGFLELQSCPLPSVLNQHQIDDDWRESKDQNN